MSGGEAFGFDAEVHQIFVETLVDMIDGDDARAKVIDTFRMMLAGQLETFERLRREHASAEASIWFAALGGKPCPLILDLECRTAAFLSDVLTKACAATWSVTNDARRLQ